MLHPSQVASAGFLLVLVGLLDCLGFATGINAPDDNDVPIIIWWDRTNLYDDEIKTCPSGNSCLVSYNESLLHKQTIMMYLFSGTGFLTNGLPFPRRDGDLWALVHEESPKNNDWLFSFESTLEVFNYTSTFKRESDFPMPIHWMKNEEMLTSEEYLVPIAEKNRLRKEEGLASIVFVHSDCVTSSQREHYMAMLQEHIDVDSYGSCLHNKDFPKEYSHLDGMQGFAHPDFSAFVARYKFAIAFENAICDDYVTEKFWRPLHLGVVPIVMGAPTLRDFVPAEKSVIMIEDFKTVKDLADLIKDLDSNDEKYEQYLEFKRDGVSNPTLLYEFGRVPQGESHDFAVYLNGYYCLLCDKLHEAKTTVKSGLPIPRAQAKFNHFGCPLPTDKLDENGKYVYDPESKHGVDYYRMNAEIARHYYDTGQNITSQQLYDLTQNWWKAKRQIKNEL